MTPEDVLAELENVSKDLEDGSRKQLAVGFAAEAVAFAWQHNTQKDFFEFLQNFRDEFTETEMTFFKEKGWLE